MNCIDAVEGSAKALLGKFLALACEYRMDASEYIRNVKAVIETTMGFIEDNPEITEAPDLVSDVLYEYAKAQWLDRLKKEADVDQGEGADPDLEYQAYCYDYLYIHGNYPR